jgi:soluble lytic murein transglycosylase-like protein
MNLEGLESVKSRIEEIRRKFVDPGLAPRPIGVGKTSGSPTFSDSLRNAQGPRSVPCPKDLEPIITAAAKKYGMDPAMVKAVVRIESGFNQRSISKTGAQGLMQLMPGTARALGVDATDPAQNIDGGVRYLRQQIDRFGSVELGLAAYNAGPGNVIRYNGVPPFDETQRYVSNALRLAEDYAGEF